jgi:hypothetical protein
VKKDYYLRVEKIIKRIENNSDKLIRLENRIEKISDKETKFQAKVAMLNHYQRYLT